MTKISDSVILLLLLACKNQQTKNQTLPVQAGFIVSLCQTIVLQA
jgi:hypothetical protein